jgi:hypothetical protein
MNIEAFPYKLSNSPASAMKLQTVYWQKNFIRCPATHSVIIVSVPSATKTPKALNPALALQFETQGLGTMKNYHKILDIPNNASADEIDQHYHLLTRIYHPDRFDEPVDKAYAEWKLRELSTAYQALSAEAPNTVGDMFQAFV